MKCNTGQKWVTDFNSTSNVIIVRSRDFEKMTARTVVTKLGQQEGSWVLYTQPSRRVFSK